MAEGSVECFGAVIERTAPDSEARSGPAVTFEEVYTRFRRPVWALARRLTRSDEEALDASQEIFLRVWKGLGGFRNEAKLSTWVFQIAWNYLRSYRRSQGRGLVPLESLSSQSGLVVGAMRDRAPDAERRAMANQQLDRVQEALDSLEEHHRVVLWMRDGEELSYEAIAEVLDIPIGTVRSRLARARKALRDEVDR